MSPALLPLAAILLLVSLWLILDPDDIEDRP